MSIDFGPKKKKERPEGGKFWQEKWLKITGIVLAVILVLFTVTVASAVTYHRGYKGKVYPGVYVGDYHLGGLTKTEVKDFVENFNNRLAEEGLDFYFFDKDDKKVKFELNTISSLDNSVDLVKLDSDAFVNQAFRVGRDQSDLENIWLPFWFRFSPHYLQAEVDLRTEFLDNLRKYFDDVDYQPQEADLTITSVSPLSYEVTEEKDGLVFNFEKAEQEVVDSLSLFTLPVVQIERQEFSPEIKKTDVVEKVAGLPKLFAYGNLSLNHIDPKTKVREDWNITPQIYSRWLEVRKEDGDAIFTFDQEEVDKYLNGLKSDIERPSQDAKFVMTDGKVEKFQASQSGISIDKEKTYKDLNTIFEALNYEPAEPDTAVTISTEITEPKVKLADANDLGISDVLGVGISSFSGSPPNRIKNIALAVQKLNGVLIKPGEVFSTNKYAGPYTTESGFLPEKIIVGDLIKTGVGGGMCQIGTTLFRGAMNAGMPIKERQNHSLVVNYYSDPLNGNPGTDATLYDPDIDFKFENDTGNYMLVQTEVDYKKQDLIFTLWGKKDGREGSYTNPLVSRWITPGEPKEIKVRDLAPGQKECQNAFHGAVSSFTYTRVTPEGEKEETVYTSYYRPVPEICQIGEDPEAEAKDNNENKEEAPDESDVTVTT